MASSQGPNPTPNPQGSAHYQAHRSVYTGRPPAQSIEQYMRRIRKCQEVSRNTLTKRHIQCYLPCHHQLSCLQSQQDISPADTPYRGSSGQRDGATEHYSPDTPLPKAPKH